MYKLNQEEFIQKYTDDIFEESQNIKYYPTIIKSILEQLSVLNLTDAEQKLYGGLSIYKELEKLPYEYVQDREFEVLKTFDTLNEKLKLNENYNRERIIELFNENYKISQTDIEDLILKKLKKNSRELFNVWNLNKKEIVEWLKQIKKDKGQYSGKNIMQLLNQLISIFAEDLNEKLLIGNVIEHKYETGPKIKCEYNSEEVYENLKDCDSFINIIDEESTDEEYIKEKGKYEEEYKKYEEILKDYWKYPGKYEYCGEPRKPEKPYYQGTKYITLKDEIKELIKWLNE